MTEFHINRRNTIKSAAVGLLGITGLTTGSIPAAAHPSLDGSATDLLGPIQVPANQEAGFNYPYYLYVPKSSQEEPVPMLVEPNNTGTATDDFEEHRTTAQKVSQGQFGWTRLFSEALQVPLLVPVFPRPRSEPLDGTHYVHALDETTMRLDSGELERVDRQLINMIEHATELLRGLSYPVADEIMLNGFSASGNFVNRFTALHPELVRSVTAGGVNGTLILPRERAKGHTLNYHIGIADVAEITGEEFDRDSWRDVAQFIYMGGEDENDTIPYDDAWSDTQRQIALEVYGEDMQADRMPYCEDVYDEAGADARFEIYEGVGHRIPLEIQEDIVAFHRRESRLKNISFTTPPTPGDSSGKVEALVFGDRDRFDVRLRSSERGDITEQPETVTAGESTAVTVALDSQIQTDEQISAIVVPSDSTDHTQAVASTTQRAIESPGVQVTGQPTVEDKLITLQYAVSSSYDTDSPIHLFLRKAESGSKQLLATFEPGILSESTYEIDSTELAATIEVGTELRVELVDIDDGDKQIASDTVTVGEESETETDTAASVRFGSQPMGGDDRIEIEYSVETTYEPTEFLTLQLQPDSETNVLLGTIEPGADRTESFSIEKIPMNAGDVADITVADGEAIARSRSVVVRDTDGAVTLEPTKEPTEDDPMTAVQYDIAESYEPRDTLTLRVYDDGMPGTDPGEAVTLLSPGTANTETFSLSEYFSEDVAEATVAIIDDQPLAVVSTAESLEGGEVNVETQDDAGDDPETETDTDDDGPGFGIGSALAGIGGAGYLLKRRLADDAQTE